MSDIERHTIKRGTNIRDALKRLNDLALDAILFVVDEDDILLGSLTDGDVRRGFIRGFDFDTSIEDFIQPNPHFIEKINFSIEKVIEFRNKNLKVVPVVDEKRRIEKILNFRNHKSYLPIQAVMMAGGRGERLKPVTDTVPKPLLTIGGKPIIQHNVERFKAFGIDNIHISVRYLGKMIEDYLTANNNNITLNFIYEDEPLGTLGAISKIPEFESEFVVVMNSDLLTNIDFEDFFRSFINADADLSVASVPYNVNIPYAVLETEEDRIIHFKEKPTYTYYSNAGIYLIKSNILRHIPKDSFYNATDFMEMLIEKGHKVSHYPILGYWLDIGKPEDYKKAQEDIKHIKLL